MPDPEPIDGVLPRACVGCGYCCRTAPCAVAVRVYPGTTRCPALQWDTASNSYRCRLVQGTSIVAHRYRQELAIGAGCCSPFNSDRRDVRCRDTAPNLPSLPVELRAVLRALGREWINRDALWMALNSAERELDRPGFTEQCLHLLTEHRNRHIEEFMG